MQNDYDPERGPEAGVWLEMSESERSESILEYCTVYEAGLPNVSLHAHIHAAVETQIAMGGEIPAAETLDRFMREGLTRHEGIHAIGWVLSRHMYHLLKGSTTGADSNSRYYEELRKFTVEQWHSESSDADDQ